MQVGGWGPVSQAAPSAELQAAYATAKQQQQGDRRGALAGTKRTRAVGVAGAQTFISLEDFEGSRKAEARLRRMAATASTAVGEAAAAEGEGGGDAAGEEDEGGDAEGGEGEVEEAGAAVSGDAGDGDGGAEGSGDGESAVAAAPSAVAPADPEERV